MSENIDAVRDHFCKESDTCFKTHLQYVFVSWFSKEIKHAHLSLHAII